MRKGSRAAALLIVVISTLRLVPVTLAQGPTADLVGTVTDTSGAVIPGAQLVGRNLDTGIEYKAVTNEEGFYALTALPAGRYSLTVTHPGFKTWTLPEVRLALGDRFRQDVRLEVGVATESIEVIATTPALQTDASSVSSLITSRAIQDLPIAGRNFVLLAQLAAGAHQGEANSLASGRRPDDRRQTSAVSVNAQPTSSNNFLIDGADNNERFIGTVMVKPSMDAIAEMRVVSNLYSAEYGRTAGGVIIFVTRSGTNQFHGSIFEFLRNEKLDARNFFDVPGTPKPKLKQNQFGGSLGGPIRQNRAFFFVDYEGLRLREGQTFVSTVPTAAMKQGNFSGVNPIFDPDSTRQDPTSPTGYVRSPFPGDIIPVSQMDSVGQKVARLYPDPIAPGLVNNYTLNPLRTQRNDTMDGRVDVQATPTTSLFSRYSLNDTSTVTPGAFPFNEATGIHPVGDTGFSGRATQRAQNALLSVVRTLGGTLVADFKASFSRFTVYSLPFNYGINANHQLGLMGTNVDEHSSGLSNFSVSGFRSLGDAGFIPLITINNLFQSIGNLAFVSGTHSIKLGGDVRRRHLTPYQSASPKGTFSFDANLTNDPSGRTSKSGNSLASLLLGYPASATRNKYLVWPGLRLWEVAAYLQDDWRARRWLTLNLGVRYDYYGPITEVANRISNVDLARGKIIVAGAEGVSRSAGIQSNKRDFAVRIGFAATLGSLMVIRGGYGINYVPPFIGSPLALRNPPFVSLYTSTATNLFPAYKLSLPFPAAVPTDPRNPTGNLAGVALDAATPYVHHYNLTLQREAGGGFVLSTGYVAALGRRQYIFNGSVNVNQPPPGPGAIQPRRPYYYLWPNVATIGIAAPWYNTNYHGLQATLERRFQGGFGLLATYTWAHSIDNFPQQQNNPKAERGNSFLDMRHRFTLLANADLPWGNRLTGAPAALLRNWKINLAATLSTGLPFNITNATPRSNTGVADRPNVLRDPRLSRSARSVARWFDTGAFEAQPLYTFGNAARNLLHGPGRQVLNVGVAREFQPSEKSRLQFRLEAFNVTNTPQFGAPGSAFGSTSFGVISSAESPRNVQIALKWVF